MDLVPASLRFDLPARHQVESCENAAGAGTMKRILIFDADEEAAAELKSAVEAHGERDVIVAPTLREACLVVTQLAQELAFIPWSEAENASQALLSLQPDLAIVAVVHDAKQESLQPEPEGAYALLTMEEIQENLPDLLGEDAEPAVAETVKEEGESAVATTVVEVERSTPSPPPGMRGFDEALEGATQHEKVVAVLLTGDDEMLKQVGSLNEDQAHLIASRISETWRPRNTALIQFLRLPSRTADLFLFTRPLHGHYLVTLVAQPGITLGKAREIVDELFRRASVEGGTSPGQGPSDSVVTAHVARSDPQQKVSYALVWQPRRPLPATIQVAVRQALERIAKANSCALTYIMVEAEVIHIVVSCPSGRNTAWVANLFKKGVEEEVQEQFGVPARLWNKGYYAAHSEEPLSEAELNLFINVRTRA